MLCYADGSIQDTSVAANTKPPVNQNANQSNQSSSKASSGVAAAGAAVEAIPGIVNDAKIDTKGVDPASEALRKKAKALKISGTIAATAGGAAAPWTFGISAVAGGATAAGLNAKAGKLLQQADKMDAAYKSKQASLQASNENIVNTLAPAPNVNPIKSNSLYQAAHGTKVKGSLLGSGQSGRIEGKGGPKTDSIHAKLDGGMVIPAEYVQTFLQSQDAKRLGLDGKQKADLSQPSGDRGRVSDGEYYIDQDTVNQAIGLGINLQKYAPNATEAIGEAGNRSVNRTETSTYQADDGTKPKFKMPEQPTQYTVQQPAAGYTGPSGNAAIATDNTPVNGAATTTTTGNSAAKGLYWRDMSKGLFVDNRANLTEEQKLLNRMKTLANVSTGLKGAGILGTTIYNALNKFKPVENEDTPAPMPMSDELDTTDEENNVKGLFLAQLHQAKEMGVNPYLFPAGTFQRGLSEIATKKQNFKYQVANQNNSLINQWMANQVAQRNNARLTNRQMAEQHRAQKSAAITSGVEQGLNLPMDFVNQRIGLEYYPKYFANLPS